MSQFVNIHQYLRVDDMVVMAESVEGLQSNLQVLSDVLSRWELKVNWRKTEMMRVARKSEECEVKIGEETIEQVDAIDRLHNKMARRKGARVTMVIRK